MFFFFSSFFSSFPQSLSLSFCFSFWLSSLFICSQRNFRRNDDDVNTFHSFSARKLLFFFSHQKQTQIETIRQKKRQEFLRPQRFKDNSKRVKRIFSICKNARRNKKREKKNATNFGFQLRKIDLRRNLDSSKLFSVERNRKFTVKLWILVFVADRFWSFFNLVHNHWRWLMC